MTQHNNSEDQDFDEIEGLKNRAAIGANLCKKLGGAAVVSVIVAEFGGSVLQSSSAHSIEQLLGGIFFAAGIAGAGLFTQEAIGVGLEANRLNTQATMMELQQNTPQPHISSQP